MEEQAKQFTLLDAKIDRLITVVETVVVRLDGVEKRLDGLEMHMDGLETRMGGLETRMGGLETRMGGLETRMGGLETRMDGLETRMGGLEKKMEDGFMEVHQMIAAFSEHVDKRFDEQQDQINDIRSQMVTKDYLDRKLADSESFAGRMIRKEQKQVEAVIDSLNHHAVIDVVETADLKAKGAFWG